MLQSFHLGEDDVIDVHFSFMMVFGGLRIFIDASHDGFVSVVLNYQNTSAIGGLNYGAPSRINSSFVATFIVVWFYYHFCCWCFCCHFYC